jgi:hypothetical protein
VVLSNKTERLQILTILDATPSVVREAQMSDFANVRLVAVNDGGTLAVIAADDGNLYVWSPSTPALFLYVAPGASACLLPDSDSLVVAEGSSGNITVINNLARSPTVRLMAAGLKTSGNQLFVQASMDGRWLFLAESGNKSAFRIDLVTGEVQSLFTLRSAAVIVEIVYRPGGSMQIHN